MYTSVFSKIKELFFVFAVGFFTYILVELAWRSYSHLSMGLAGGFSLLCIYFLCCAFPQLNFIIKSLLSAVAITIIELIFGLILNRFLGLSIWDYSTQAFNLMGQICPLFSALWFFLCLPIIPLCKLLNRVFSSSTAIPAQSDKHAA
jgi:uncharacterized membrane protein